jgi:hypothetical protein
MVLDILLLIIVAAIIALAAAEGLARSLVMLFGFYLLSLLLGIVIVAFNIAEALNNLIIRSMGNQARSTVLYQGLIFLGLLIPAFVIAVIISHYAVSREGESRLQWLDNVLGTLVGVGLGLVFAAVVCNTWGVMVSTRWRPFDTWIAMRLAYDSSFFRPFMLNVLNVYRKLLFPFALSGYPIFFIPQR